MFEIDGYKFKNDKEILLQVDKLTLAKTGLISICGEIGCGKSTLLKSLINFTEYEGTILYNDINIKQMSINDKISYIPQNLEYYFLTNTLREEVILATGVEIDFYEDLVKKFNISHLIDSNIDSISGGEQIRCALFLNELCLVECLILDETLSMNDHKNLSMLSDEVTKLSKNKLIIEVSHDLTRISKADTILFICNKKIVQFDSFKEFKNYKYTSDVWSFNV